MASSADSSPQHDSGIPNGPLSETQFSRRRILLGAGAAGLAAVRCRSGRAQPASTSPATHVIRIAPARWRSRRAR